MLKDGGTLPYPLIPMLSFDELRVRLENDFDCVLKNIDDSTPPVTYFERMYNGKKMQCPVSFKDDNEILTPTVLRYICRRLNIDPKEFDLHLG